MCIQSSHICTTALAESSVEEKRTVMQRKHVCSMSKYKDAHLILLKVINIFVVIFAHHRHHQVNESKCKINVQNHPHADDVYFHLEKGPTAVRACQGSLGGGVSNTCHAASAFLHLFLLSFCHHHHHFYCYHHVFHHCFVLFVPMNYIICKARILY